MRLNSKKTKSMVVSRSQTYAPGNSNLPVSGAELEEVKSLRVLGKTFDSKSTFGQLDYLREVVSITARSPCVVRRVGKSFECLQVLKSCAYVLSNLEYCAPAWMSSGQSYLSLLDSVVRSAERLFEGKLCCLGHIVLSLLYNFFFHRADHPLPEYLHHLVATRNTRASAALCK